MNAYLQYYTKYRETIRRVTTGSEQKEISCGGKAGNIGTSCRPLSSLLDRKASTEILSALGKEKHTLFKSNRSRDLPLLWVFITSVGAHITCRKKKTLIFCN